MMTMLVAIFGLLPAALSHVIGSDSQRPFAIVIVGGLISDLVMSIFLLPTLYVWVSRDGDKLPEPEQQEQNAQRTADSNSSFDAVRDAFIRSSRAFAISF